ncbi:hypothetical protein ACHAW6_009387 [Cyclotella cf. meneghiniana]
MTEDINFFYLNTLFKRFEYLKLRLTNLKEDVSAYYKLQEKTTPDGFVYFEVRKGMYGLPQAGLLVQEWLEKRLNENGFTQLKFTPGLGTHASKPIQFTMFVVNFGIKYVGKDTAQFLVESLKEKYTISSDWEGKKYMSLMLDWDYYKGEVHLSMPGYLEKALRQFGLDKPSTKQD